MKAIIDKILKEEEGARKNLDSARAKASEIINSAHAEAKRQSDELILEAENLAKEKKEQAEEESIAEKKKIIDDAKDKALQFRQQREKNIPETSKRIFSEIIDIK
jgi:F0F1-type ATP synthase membrane subunit b/b'